jgi:hypothetical protein
LGFNDSLSVAKLLLEMLHFTPRFTQLVHQVHFELGLRRKRVAKCHYLLAQLLGLRVVW